MDEPNEYTEYEITVTTQGFDAWLFLVRAEDYRLRKACGLAGWREIKEQMEFERAAGEGNA